MGGHWIGVAILFIVVVVPLMGLTAAIGSIASSAWVEGPIARSILFRLADPCSSSAERMAVRIYTGVQMVVLGGLLWSLPGLYEMPTRLSAGSAEPRITWAIWALGTCAVAATVGRIHSFRRILRQAPTDGVEPIGEAGSASPVVAGSIAAVTAICIGLLEIVFGVAITMNDPCTGVTLLLLVAVVVLVRFVVVGHRVPRAEDSTGGR